MDDLISRQAAIDALRVAYWDDNIQSAKDDPCIVDAMTDWAIRQVKALPSAQPEREILDELMDIMKEYYFTHRYEYDEAWENGFAKCMNLIPNVYMKRGKDR